jgi:hypothetical protein
MINIGLLLNNSRIPKIDYFYLRLYYPKWLLIYFITRYNHSNNYNNNETVSRFNDPCNGNRRAKA